MKYTKLSHATNQTLQLQSIGHVLGTPSGELKPGDFLLWNFGTKCKVLEIVKETVKTITIRELSETGYTGERKLFKTRLVCRLEKEPSNLCFGHLGNGVTVWRSESEDMIAHIASDRSIKIYGKVSFSEKCEIEDYATFENPETSYSNPQKVFKVVR